MGTNPSTPVDQNPDQQRTAREKCFSNMDDFNGSEGELSFISPNPMHSYDGSQPRPRRIDTLT